MAKGIFCLEGDWWSVKDKTSVEPLLRLLETAAGWKVPYVHHDTATHEEFHHYLKKWSGRTFASHPILYLGFHGEPGSITVGEGRRPKISLDELADRLEGACRRRVIHFGSCSTLDVHGRELNRFLDRTGACALLGFRSDVDWMKSTAFELLLMGLLQDVSFTRPGMQKLWRLLKENVPGLMKILDFRMWPEPDRKG